MQCSICEEEGHNARTCPKKEKAVSAKASALVKAAPASAGLSLTKKPSKGLASVKFTEKPTKVITGRRITVVDERGSWTMDDYTEMYFR